MDVIQTIEAVHALKYQAPGLAAQSIARHGLTREMVPTELLTHAVVWEALLERMPLTALVRNLGVMTKVGVLAPMSASAGNVVARLGDRKAIKAARVHPIALLAALKTYAQGHGMKGKNSWRPVPQVVDALDRAFYLAFENVPSTGQRVMLALDVSGSMSTRVYGHGVPRLPGGVGGDGAGDGGERAVPHVHGLHGGKLPVALVARTSEAGCRRWPFRRGSEWTTW